MRDFIYLWWREPDLNWWHTAFQAAALPTELPRQELGGIIGKKEKMQVFLDFYTNPQSLSPTSQKKVAFNVKYIIIIKINILSYEIPCLEKKYKNDLWGSPKTKWTSSKSSAYQNSHKVYSSENTLAPPRSWPEGI